MDNENLGMRNSHVIKLMAKDWKELASLLTCAPLLVAVVFIFLPFFFLCFVLYLFYFVVFFIFRADTS